MFRFDLGVESLILLYDGLNIFNFWQSEYYFHSSTYAIFANARSFLVTCYLIDLVGNYIFIVVYLSMILVYDESVDLISSSLNNYYIWSLTSWGSWSFHLQHSKLVRFRVLNEHAKRKKLYFENWRNPGYGILTRFDHLYGHDGLKT